MEKEKFKKEFSEDLLATWAKNSFGIEIKANEKALFKEFCIDVILGNPVDEELWSEVRRKLLRIETTRKDHKLHKNEKKDKLFYTEDIVVFYKWYFEQEAKCYYCGVTEFDMKQYFSVNNDRGGKRGKSLEIDKLEPEGLYKSNGYEAKFDDAYLTKNCKLACYPCNNAKSDFWRYGDFKEIAEKAIKPFWEKEKERNPHLYTSSN